jgi:hypothetical protein
VFKQPPLLPLPECVLLGIQVDVPTSEGELVFHIVLHQPIILTGPHLELGAPYFAGWVQRQEPDHHLLGVEGVGLRAEAAGGGAGSVEVAAQSRSQERAEDDLGTPKAGVNPALGWDRGRTTYLKAGRDSHRRKTNLKV